MSIVLSFFACGKKETTSSPPTPKYSIKEGDSWLFQRKIGNNIDTVKVIARPETLINNIKFLPLFDTLTENNEVYINASDSIILAFPYTHNNKIYYVISRLIRPTAKKGDTWADSTIIEPNNIIIKVITRVDSVNVQETVPAGTFTTTLISQEYWYIEQNKTSSQSSIFLQVIVFISENPIFVRVITSYLFVTEDHKLIKYTRAH